MKKVLYRLDVVFFLCLAAVLGVYSRWSLRVIAGMALAALGFTLWMIARRQLGSSFSPTARATKLVTTGLYATFRNPIYLFGQVAYLGLAIAWGQPAGFFLVAILCPAQYLRVRKEQRVLEAAFGQQYRDYRARTWF